MAKFLTTTGVSHKLEELIKSSHDKLYLVSPYLKIADNMKYLIKERDLHKIDLRVVYRKDTKINTDDINFLQGLTSIKLSCCENLHAKCYLNENTAILTSMNLYLYSQQNNKEMGILVDKSADPDLYNKIYDEVRSIIQASDKPEFAIKKIEKENPVEPKSNNKPNISNKPNIGNKPNISNGSGFCIRCRSDLKLNPERPLCYNCFKSWEQYSNPDYQENFCHICGNESIQSVEKPVCYSCYKKLKK